MSIDLMGFDVVNGFALAALAVALVVLLLAIRSAGRHRETIARLREEIAGQKPLIERLPGIERDLREANSELHRKQLENSRLETEVKTLKESHQARLEEIREMKKELEEKFSFLASGVLKSNSERFLDLVSERFKQHKAAADEDLSKRQTAIKELVKPLDEKLGKFDQRINEIEKARNEAYGAIRTQVLQLAESQKTLGQETRRLVQALRAPKTRGRWGEMQLRQVFEMAGMVENVDFLSESSIETEDGLRRPDAIVNIPGGKSIVIDAKTPLEAYLDALESPTPEQQKEHLARHASQVRKHVQLLSSKAYQDLIPTTPDFVVMFIPGETFVSAAAENDAGLIEYAFERKVLIASPTTLMALIKAIAYGWQQEKMAENAAEVQKLAKEMYDRLGNFAEHLQRVGKSLGQSVDNYNKAVGSLEGRILPSARKFESMGVVSGKSEIAAPAGVEREPRKLTASEFVKGDKT